MARGGPTVAGTTAMVEVRRVSQCGAVGAISIIVDGITADACALPGQAQDNPSDGRSLFFAEYSQNIKATAALVTKRRPTPPKKAAPAWHPRCNRSSKNIPGPRTARVCTTPAGIYKMLRRIPSCRATANTAS